MVIRMTRLKKLSIRAAAVLGLCLLGLTACRKASHEAAKKVKFEETQLNVPGLSTGQKSAADKVLDWHMENLVEGYNKFGSRNPKWDSWAQDALKIWAQGRAYGANVKGFPSLVGLYSSKAVEAGCDDAMIRYVYVRFGNKPVTPSAQEAAQAYQDAKAGLARTKYHALYKYYGAIRTVSALEQVKPWQGMPIYSTMDEATRFLAEALEDRGMPAKEASEACLEYLPHVKQDVNEVREFYERIETVLMKKWDKEAMTYLVRGIFYTDYAWKGRSSAYADKVTPEQWKLFGERLAIAEEALRKGMELNPKDGRLATQMIRVVSGQNKGLEEMKKWFESAMVADPNNYDAGDTLMYFLLPRWYGSREDMIAFGRYCEQSDKWGGTVPLMLAEAHYTYNKFDGARDGSYWKQPDVWPDIKESYDKFFSKNPNATGWRHNYARYAYWCEQWDVLLEQIPLLGDEINYDFFGGQEAYDKMVKQAEEHRKK